MGAREPHSLIRDGAHLKAVAAVLAGLLSMTIGCGTPQPPEQAERWAKAWIESLNSHRIQQVTALLDPAATYQDPMTGKPLSSDALTFFLLILWKHAPESRYTLRSVNGTREFLAVEWSATDLGSGTGTKPLEGVFLLHFDGDHITSVRGYYDTAAVASGTH